ncbi:MAG: serine/threonine protein kinase [Deltaproteobacteria bacterium]|nr:serine/threonine protein kinase [Deltaproteobacteria bacterium]
MTPVPKSTYQRFGKYILLDRINIGGMAEVFRGKQTGVEGFQKLVAIKRILPAIAEDEDFVEMFVDEAKLAVQLQHANIAQIFDLGEVDKRYYIAMEYVSGADLRTVWDRARRRNRLLPIAMSCYIVQRVCEGLDYAHRKRDEGGRDIGLVHRDVSPQNVLLAFEGEVKVVDFGIALARHKVSKTQAGVLKGKFGYMSPEQVRGVELDHRSDIFACGILLWEMLVGDRLFLGESDFSTLEKVRNVEMVPPTNFNKNLSPQVERIVMKALSKNRDDRYRYASEMAEDLARYLYASNQPFARPDLQRYMHQHFGEEIKEEQARLEAYRDIVDQDLEPAAPTGSKWVHGPPVLAANVVEPTGRTEVGQLANLPPGVRGRPLTFSGEYDGPGQPTPLPDLGTAMIAGGAQAGRAPVAGSTATGPPLSASTFDDSSLRDVQDGGGLSTGAKVMMGALAVVAAGVVGAAVLFASGVLGPAKGALTVQVEPADAEIYLNDALVAAQAPFSAEAIEAGAYVLAVKKAGYLEVIRSVKVQPSQLVVENVKLERAASASVMVRSTPADLAVWIDGQDTSRRTPAMIAQLVSGSHQVELRQDGVVVYQASLQLADQAAEVVEVDITGLPPVLEVASNEPGAEVWIDRKKVGLAPQRIDTLKPGEVLLEIKKKGCKTVREKVDLKPAITHRLNPALQCR